MQKVRVHLTMKQAKTSYDIFISYRRIGGAQYARILQLMLTQRGYRVFLDYDELKDGRFNERIREAIESSTIFMMVLSKNSLDRCENENDWVRKELLIANKNNKQFIPVNPDNEFDGIHTDVPEEIKYIIENTQHSDIFFGKYLGTTVETMVHERIEPFTGVRTPKAHTDADYESAKQTLAKLDAYRKRTKRLFAALSAILILAIGCGFFFLNRWHQDKLKHEEQTEHLAFMRSDIERRYDNFRPGLREGLSEEKLMVIDRLLASMRPLRNDSLWISQYEFSKGDWAIIMGEECDENEKNLPATDLSFIEISELLFDSLANMTGLSFNLPSEEDWIYAAQGGKYRKNYIYSGSDNPTEVAWFIENSRGKLHDARDTEMQPNHLDLYNMSGNAGELCNSSWDGDDGREGWIVCGGNYQSGRNDITITAKLYLPFEGKDKKVGFRPILIKE